MNLIELLQDISIEGWQLWSEGEQLCYDAPKEESTALVLAQLKQHKAEILQLLQDRPDILNVYPLSYGQKALWFLWQLAPESHAYNVSFSARIWSVVDITAMEKAFGVLRERHPILRTTFPERGSEPIQQLHQNQELDFLLLDASTWSEDELKAKVVETHQLPFDLERGPVMRVRWFTCSNQDHVLLLTIHHVACDGWSIDLLIQELPKLYQAQRAGVEASLPPLKHSYQDYVRWQRDILQGTEGERLWNYWQQQLAGELPVLNLPTARPRSPIQTYNGASHHFKLSDKLTKQLKELAGSSGATLYMMLLAAFEVLLYRYTGQEDILVGSPTSGRSQPEFAPLLGYFVDPVVMRANFSGNPRFKDFLVQVRHTVLEALTHQDYPFALLVEKLQPHRDPSRSPIFQASFALQKLQKSQDIQKLFVNEIEKDIDWGGLKIRPFEIPQYEGQFDLTLEMMEASSSVFGTFKYNTDLFDGSTIERMAGHFQNLLSAIVENPQVSVGELSLLSEAERHQLLVEWNDTAREYPSDKCIHQLFEEQVEKTPLSVAVVFENQQLTYCQLNQRANQLAHHLQSLGVAPEVLVGICVERSVEMVVGLLGILKAGGAYVPLDPNYPAERLSYMLADSGVEVLLTQSSLLESLPQHQAQVVCLDRDWGTIEQNSQDNLDVGVSSDNLAYAIYTSGSTGQPKGVAMKQLPLVNLILWQLDNSTLSSGARTVQFAPISFDVSCQEIFSTWCSGGTLILISEEVRRDPLALLHLLTEAEIERLFLPFVALQQLAEGAVTAKQVPTSLREIITAGEQLQISPLIINLFGKLKDCTLHNQYGPSESHVVTAFNLTGSASSWPVLPPIGRPIENTQIYLLDQNLQPVPIGVPGELYIGGICLARCYINRLELTKERFIPDPFKDDPEARLYKTGDVARYLSDGNIEYIGRIDNQVKIRGFRIELGEIESLLNIHPQIQQAVVIATEELPGDKRLVAYVVTSDESLSTNQLREFLKQKLPEYMVPSAFVTLDALPLTPNGKVDRKALPAPDGEIIREHEYVAPHTQSEEIIANIFASVLGVQKVGIHDNFFDLGGHSLLATQLILRLREVLEVEIPLKTLFENPNVSELANIIERLVLEKDYPSEPIDLEAEAILAPDIQLSGTPIQLFDKPESIFLTGATGFLGIYLLHELLQTTSATIYCLVRSVDAVSGRQRLESKLRSYNLWNESFISRIIPVVGDLANSRFGLSIIEYDTLAKKIDVIYHNGAYVNHLWSYNLLKQVNVLGTQEVLRLASQVKIKPVHFVSTVGVFPTGQNSQLIIESEALNHPQELKGGYSQSKWVAEKIVWEAANLGLPVSIYRPARITGHSQTGMSNIEDFFSRFVKGCILLKSAPMLNNFRDNLVPVDYVSRAIVHLSQQNNSFGKAFHLTNPESTPLSNIYNWIRLLGYPIEEIDYDHWRSRLMKDLENPLYPYLVIFPEVASEFQWLEYDCHNVLSCLAGTDIELPKVDEKLFRTYISYFKERQFLAFPQQKTITRN